MCKTNVPIFSAVTSFASNPNNGSLRIALGDLNDPYSLVTQVTLNECKGPSDKIDVGRYYFDRDAEALHFSFFF